MKLNIADPSTGGQKRLEIDDDKKFRIFLDKRISQDVPGDELGDEFKGYVFKITGGHDKDGFAMMQGVLVGGRVRLLLGKGSPQYTPKRRGARKRRSVRGCIVNSDISVLNLTVVKKGEQELPGITDVTVERRLGPKRANNIRKLFALSKEDDVRKFVIRRELPAKEGKKKPQTKAPRIQRLVTPIVLQRKRHRIALKRRRAIRQKEEAAAYAKMMAERKAVERQAAISRKKSLSKRKSEKK